MNVLLFTMLPEQAEYRKYRTVCLRWDSRYLANDVKIKWTCNRQKTKCAVNKSVTWGKTNMNKRCECVYEEVWLNYKEKWHVLQALQVSSTKS